MTKKLDSKIARLAAVLLLPGLAACGGGYYGAQADNAPPSGNPHDRGYNAKDSIVGDGGASLTRLLGVSQQSKTDSGIQVNKYLWQATLDTLNFLPLASTDPFTGVIATDWGATQDVPDERFKVTAYLLSPDLQASSLKVAVYREKLTNGVWVPVGVDPKTPRQLEDAILTRARQIRIGDVAKTGSKTG